MLVSTRRRHQVYFSLLVIYYVVYYDSRITHKTGRRMRPAVRMGVIEKLAHPFCLSCAIVCSFAVVDRCCQGPPFGNVSGLFSLVWTIQRQNIRVPDGQAVVRQVSFDFPFAT
jgi:hypothetical protein